MPRIGATLRRIRNEYLSGDTDKVRVSMTIPEPNYWAAVAPMASGIFLYVAGGSGRTF